VVVFFVLIWFYKASNFESYLVITVNTICSCDEDCSFSLFVPCFSGCGVCLSLYVLFILIGCAGSVGISLASRVMYIICVCVSAVWCAVPVQFYLGTSVVWAAGLYGFYFLSGSEVAGTVRLKW
jgi:hypothetical protein